MNESEIDRIFELFSKDSIEELYIELSNVLGIDINDELAEEQLATGLSNMVRNIISEQYLGYFKSKCLQPENRNAYEQLKYEIPLGIRAEIDKELLVQDQINQITNEHEAVRFIQTSIIEPNYFFEKTLDKVRPGGVVAFITSKGTLDKENPNVRKYIAQRADLLGAIRLPNNTFVKNAGTEVTSDIIFLQKRENMTDIMPDWVYLDTNGNGIKMNKYFVSNPEMILRTIENKTTQFGLDTTCVPNDIPLQEQLSSAIENIHGEIIDYEIEDIKNGEQKFIIADPNVKNYYDTIQVNPNSLKYQWTQSTNTPTKDSFKNSFTSGQSITKNSGDGKWYL